jgi:hypothetical protein
MPLMQRIQELQAERASLIERVQHQERRADDALHAAGVERTAFEQREQEAQRSRRRENEEHSQHLAQLQEQLEAQRSLARAAGERADAAQRELEAMRGTRAWRLAIRFWGVRDRLTGARRSD